MVKTMGKKQTNCPLPSAAQFCPFTVTVTPVPKADRVWVWPLCVFLSVTGVQDPTYTAPCPLSDTSISGTHSHRSTHTANRFPSGLSQRPNLAHQWGAHIYLGIDTLFGGSPQGQCTARSHEKLLKHPGDHWVCRRLVEPRLRQRRRQRSPSCHSPGEALTGG